ncbi:mechanosensitive ion channel family protein [Colwellia sp. MEBiC06753]
MLSRKLSLLLVTLFLSLPIAAWQTPQSEISLKKMLDIQESEQQNNGELGGTSADIPTDEYKRGQPRSSIAGFLHAAREYDFETASNYLDYRNISEQTKAIGKAELARQLSVILNRTIWVDLQAVSDQPQGNLADNLPAYRELIGQVDTPKGPVNILLQRVPRADDRVSIWKISNATVENIPRLFKHYSYSPFGEWLSKVLPAGDIFGVMYWQWLYFLSLLICFYLISSAITWTGVKLLKTIKPKTSVELIRLIRGPLNLLFTIALVRIFIPQSNITHAAQALVEGATLLTITWVWAFFCLIDLLKTKLASRFLAQDKPLAIYLLRPASTVAKSLIVITGVLIWFENLGFSATTLLAGLGIGGLAVALAAQKTVENIIGAITLYTSTPVKIGNFCRFGSQLGVVEEIGLRATRIRTIERTVIHIANAQFIDMQIENFSERERIAYRPKIKLALDCKKDHVEAFMQAFKATLQANSLVDESPCRVYVKDINPQGIELYVLSYINTLDYETYLATTNDLNLSILALSAEHHCPLAKVPELN